MNTYRIRNQADLIAIAQIIGFGFAALGSLSLSMADNISLSMTLRLRGNAIALNRAAEQNRRSLNADPAPNSAARLHDSGETPAIAEPTSPPPPPRAELAADPAAEEKRHQAMWAIAMVNESSELTASIPHLPPA